MVSKIKEFLAEPLELKDAIKKPLIIVWTITY